ncbi:hypothetical protein BC831DRAFT_451559 [Entophlyctis helioformis]|nr:hypothetical protein BC831DRAFT_451559 [Entophlyctis helioformis]
MLSFKKKNRVGANSSTGTVKEESGSNASINSAVATGRESGSVDGHIQGHTRESSAPVHSSLRHSDNTHDGPISPTGIPDRPQSGNSHSQSQEHHHGHAHHAHHHNGANAGSIGTKSRAHHRRMSASPSSESSSSKHADTTQPSSGASPGAHASGLSSSATFTSPLNAYAQSPLGSHGGLGHAAAGPVDAAGGAGVPADDPPPAIVVDEPSRSTDSLTHRPVIRDLQSLGSLPVRRGVLQGSAESEGLVASSTAASMTSTTYLASRTSGTMRLASGGSTALAAPVSPSALTATSGLLGPGKSNTSVSSGATSTSMSPMSGSATGLSTGRPSVGGSGYMVSSPVRVSGSMAGSSNLGIAIPPSSSSFMANASSRSAGCLTQAERVVGSFLFLRFFVPAITSPETSSLLLSDKLTPARRRGLVLCGKLLTALCNDIEFGNKEDYLMYFNDYLKGYRDSMKNYIHFASSMEELSSPLTRDGFGGRSVREPESLSRQPTSKAAMTYNPSLVTAAFTAATAAISEPVDTEGEIVLDDTPQQRAAELDRQSTIIKPKQSKPVPPSEKNANGEPTPSQAADVGSLLAPPDQDPGLPRKLSSVHRKTILSQSMPALTVETQLDTAAPCAPQDWRSTEWRPVCTSSQRVAIVVSIRQWWRRRRNSSIKWQTRVSQRARHGQPFQSALGISRPPPTRRTRPSHASGGAGGSNSTITGAMGTLTRHGDTGGPSTTTSPIPPSVVIADLTSLFQCLVKSIDKVEREVDDRVPQWPDAKLSQSVLANFNDLKELLEHGPYSETDKTGGHSKKKATWWSRIFKIRGIFK